MAWIDTIREDRWEGPLGQLFDEVADRAADRVDNIMQIHSLNPAGMASHNAMYWSAMTGTRSLCKVERELIALVVSAYNDCHY